MSLLAVPIIAVCGLLVSLLVVIYCVFTFKKQNKSVKLLHAQQQANDLMVNELQGVVNTLQLQVNNVVSKSEHDLLETTQVSKQLEHRIKTIQAQLQSYQQQIQQLQEGEGHDKFYARAFKLAEKGADIEEIMAECELPRAEAEMLLSVYLQRNSTI
ncbi:DUF2802 domain-containing protein [Litorilituus lipolyticus]|uniref:DUF2802 domain-containing protein n=1 Tax=Litorilituus lipolyticus TaxID=2491017 RepID=A0A502L4K2_9GAMM|nr:DUF2802 domain-containing protein [Litorilituus lipolyticus]TPH17191.1 DUF2802 domain-containing protein [Litorilituus lipolyticus]